MRPRRLVASLALVPILVSFVSAQATGIREVSASDRSLIPLTTKLRFTTMILLPEGEEILDVVCGDRDFWVISATHNIAHVKPAKEGASTNLNLVAASGTVYSFLLSENKSVPPDLKLYVTSDDQPQVGRPKYYSANQLQAVETELAEARVAVDAAQHRSDEAIAAFKQQYPATLQFTYRVPPYEKPFFIRAIWHDGQFTYIRSDARELPALYELTDGRPAFLSYQVHAGTYVVPKVLDRGYFALGKQRFSFQQGQ